MIFKAASPSSTSSTCSHGKPGSTPRHLAATSSAPFSCAAVSQPSCGSCTRLPGVFPRAGTSFPPLPSINFTNTNFPATSLPPTAKPSSTASWISSPNPSSAPCSSGATATSTPRVWASRSETTTTTPCCMRSTDRTTLFGMEKVLPTRRLMARLQLLLPLPFKPTFPTAAAALLCDGM